MPGTAVSGSSLLGEDGDVRTLPRVSSSEADPIAAFVSEASGIKHQGLDIPALPTALSPSIPTAPDPIKDFVSQASGLRREAHDDVAITQPGPTSQHIGGLATAPSLMENEPQRDSGTDTKVDCSTFKRHGQLVGQFDHFKALLGC